MRRRRGKRARSHPPHADDEAKRAVRPREEHERGFPILGNLELDLELDDMSDIVPAPPIQTFRNQALTIPHTATTTSIQSDPDRTLFFPRPRFTATTKTKNRFFKDIYDVMQEREPQFPAQLPAVRAENEDEEAARKSCEGRKV